MIEMRELGKSFGDRSVLRGLSFTVRAGEIYGLLGPNGAGKTTAISILSGLLDAENGEALVEGRKASDSTRRRVGVVPQEITLYLNLTCRENLDFFASAFGLSAAARRRRTNELIAMFGLEEYAEAQASRLSGGWRRRLNFAVALVHSPPILILDEPTSGVDIEARYGIWRLIENLRQSGVTILLTTHHLEEAERLCTRIGIIREGRIVAEGTLAELRSTIPAVLLAMVESRDEMAVQARAAELGWAVRRYGGGLTLLLPQSYALKEVVDRLGKLSLSTVSIQPVGLEHVYMDATDNAEI